MQKHIIFFGALAGLLPSTAYTDESTKVPDSPSNQSVTRIDQLTPTMVEAITILLKGNNLELLPNGQLLLRSITVNDLIKFGIIKETTARDGTWTPG